jgi:peptidoglycan hydrolase FlgJ
LNIPPLAEIAFGAANAPDVDAPGMAKAGFLKTAHVAEANSGSGRPADFSVHLAERPPGPSALTRQEPSQPPDAFVRFEAMILQTFIAAMLPPDSEEVFGAGLAGEMWKSMLAEQIAAEIARRGATGIADRILQTSSLLDADTAP